MGCCKSVESKEASSKKEQKDYTTNDEIAESYSPTTPNADQKIEHLYDQTYNNNQEVSHRTSDYHH